MSEEVAAGEVADQGLIDQRIIEDKVLDVLGEGQFGNRHLVLDRARLLLGDLGGEQVADDVLGLPGYARGGMVGNGIWNQNSILARYAGGGYIGLAGGEFVMPAPQTRANLPMLEAMRSGGGANDNGAVVAAIAGQTRALGAMLAHLERRMAAVEEKIGEGNQGIRRLEVEASRPDGPKLKKAS